MRPSFVAALCEAAAQDPRIWLLCGDLGYSALEPFRDTFASRYVNVGVAEQNMAGIAAGMARTGKIVFTYSIANFPTLRCLEQIRNDICYHEANVKVVAVGAGFSYSSQGYTHHGVEDIAIMRALPGMTVVSPGDPVETKLATRAIIDKPGPCYLRLGKAGEPVLHATPPAFELGKAIQMTEGNDLTLITTGTMLKDVLDLGARLRAGGIASRVLSMHTISPLDVGAIQAASRETTAIVTIEEHSVTGGLGSAVADVLAEMDGPRVAFKKIGVPARLYHEIGSQKYMRQLLGDVDAIARETVLRGRASAGAK
jgi:transketolase